VDDPKPDPIRGSLKSSIIISHSFCLFYNFFYNTFIHTSIHRGSTTAVGSISTWNRFQTLPVMAAAPAVLAIAGVVALAAGTPHPPPAAAVRVLTVLRG
jgi:hypothetical protein